jgi:hypothetical protein
MHTSQRPKFQQRHYEAIAGILCEHDLIRLPQRESRAEQWQRLVSAFASLFAQDNPHFKADRFRAACNGQMPAYGNRRVGPAMPYVKPQR